MFVNYSYTGHSLPPIFGQNLHGGASHHFQPGCSYPGTAVPSSPLGDASFAGLEPPKWETAKQWHSDSKDAKMRIKML
jgi:hypothetical protein